MDWNPVTTTANATFAGQQSFLELFEDAPLAYHEVDAAGIVRRVNRAECRALGYTPEEMLGKPIWDFLAPEDRRVSRESFDLKLRSTERFPPFRRTMRSKQGQFLAFEVHANRITDNAGNRIGMRMLMIDITEHLAREEAHSERSQWSAAALESLQQGILAVDSLGVVRFFNSQAERLLDFSRGTCFLGAEMGQCLPNCTIETATAGTMSLAAFLDASLVEPQGGLAIIRAEDMAPVRVNATATPMLGASGSVIGSVITFQELPDSPRLQPAIW